MTTNKTEYHEKFWGGELWIANNEKYCGKILYLKKDHHCSFHYHKIKDETFYILKGTVIMSIDKDTIIMNEGDVQHIPTGLTHQFIGITDAEILEVSTQHFEDDSYRLSKSGRI